MLSVVAVLSLPVTAQAQTDESSIQPALPLPSGSPPLSESVQEEARWREILEREPNNAEAHARLARALKEQAADAYREVIRLAPGDPSAWPSEIQRYLSLSETIEAYREAIRLTPERTKSYLDLGWILKEANHNRDAIEVYQQAIQIEDTLDDLTIDFLYSGLGFALLNIRQYEEAEMAFRTAIERAPYTSTSHLKSLATALNRQGKAEETEAVYRQIIQSIIDYKQQFRDTPGVALAPLNPDDTIRYPNATGDSELSRAYTDLGNFFEEQGRLTEAEEAYKQTLDVSFPDGHYRVNLSKAHAYRSLGELYRSQGREEEATEVFETIRTWFPEYFERFGLSIT